MNCKITDKDGKTYNNTQWEEGVWHRATGEGNELCSSAVIHYYADPLLAVFANHIHGHYDPETMLLWEFIPDGEVNGDALKKACKSGRTIKQIPIPVLSIEQRVKIAILAAKQVYREKEWNKWADRWLDGSNRDRAAAAYAANAANTATYAAANATLAASAAASATYAAASAAADAASAAANTVNAIYATTYAAYAAYDVATRSEIDILSIIRKVVEE